MSFLNPAAFYLIGTIPIVIALHFLRLRRQSYIVPSILLWRDNPEDRKANVPFQRLRNWLLPLLQCLFLLFIVISIARPALHIPGIIHGKIVFIVDNSASMLSREMGHTRLDIAKQEVLKHIMQVSASGGMMIISTHPPGAHIQQTFTADEDKLRSAVKSITTSHSASDLSSVFALVSQHIDSANDHVYYVSDSFENLPPTFFPINTINVGESAENIGIVHLNVERLADQFQILTRIRNWTHTDRDITTQLMLVGGGIIDEKNVLIPAGTEKSVLFSINADRLEGHAISLQLIDAEDDFDLDNAAWVIPKPKRELRILLISNRKQPFLTDLLQSYGEHVQLQTTTMAEFHGSGDADVTIIDGDLLLTGHSMNTVDTQGIVYINWHGDLPDVEDTPELIETPVSVMHVNRTHTIMQEVSLQGLHLKQSLRRDIPYWGESLVETEKGALIWIGTTAGRQYLVFEFDAFNPEVSEFPFTIPDVPIFIYQCLSWFESETVSISSIDRLQNISADSFKTGDRLMIDIPVQEDAIIEVKKPDGERIELQKGVFAETDRIGIYSVFVDDALYERFSVNLLNADESALNTSNLSPDTNELFTDNTFLQPLVHEVWQWVVLFGVCLLLCEWWLYHRH